MNGGAPSPRRRRKPNRYHHGNLRPVLLDVASELLEANGVAELSLRKVASLAGVSQSAPYNHFQDKNALLTALAARGFLELKSSIDRAIERNAPSDSAGKLYALGYAYLDFGLSRRQHLQLMFGGYVPDRSADQELHEASQVTFSLLRDYVADFMAEGNMGRDGGMGPRTAAIAAWSLVHGLLLLLVDHRIDAAYTEAGTREALIDQVLGIFVDALRAGA